MAETYPSHEQFDILDANIPLAPRQRDQLNAYILNLVNKFTVAEVEDRLGQLYELETACTIESRSPLEEYKVYKSLVSNEDLFCEAIDVKNVSYPGTIDGKEEVMLELGPVSLLDGKMIVTFVGLLEDERDKDAAHYVSMGFIYDPLSRSKTFRCISAGTQDDMEGFTAEDMVASSLVDHLAGVKRIEALDTP